MPGILCKEPISPIVQCQPKLTGASLYFTQIFVEPEPKVASRQRNRGQVRPPGNGHLAAQPIIVSVNPVVHAITQISKLRRSIVLKKARKQHFTEIRPAIACGIPEKKNIGSSG